MNPSSHSEAAGIFHNAEAALRAGDRKAALSGVLMALALAPQHPIYRRAALNILGVTSGYKSLPTPVLDALRHCTTDAALDLQSLSLVLKTLFEADGRFAAMEATLNGSHLDIESAISSGAWDWFFGEPLLFGVLSRATLIGVRFEQALTKLRRHVRVSHSVLATKHSDFIAALALQLNAARFPWITASEEQTPAPTALIRALYQPLLAFTDAEAIELPEILQAARQTMLERQERARALPTLTTIDDRISQLVQSQYEGYPYPPWDALGDVAPAPFAAFVAARFPGIAVQSKPPELLSAGCGTGRGAVMLALTFPEASITALDLSRASLAYAALKAEQHGASNITFGVGDILNVSALAQKFDLIESAGVLHHMADPAAGLRALAAALKPNGLMRIALYSERGRTAVIAARHVIWEHNIPDTDDGVRTARQILIGLPKDDPARAVVDTPEFFTLDGLHDLIFNVQELRFTPSSLKVLLFEAGLEFLGFDLTEPNIKQKFVDAFPGDASARDLDKWDAFEHNNPGIFSEMYQFWCARSR